jgi:hypothetical protein
MGKHLFLYQNREAGNRSARLLLIVVCFQQLSKPLLRSGSVDDLWRSGILVSVLRLSVQ